MGRILLRKTEIRGKPELLLGCIKKSNHVLLSYVHYLFIEACTHDVWDVPGVYEDLVVGVRATFDLLAAGDDVCGRRARSETWCNVSIQTCQH